jgi:hypothetical protein
MPVLLALAGLGASLAHAADPPVPAPSPTSAAPAPTAPPTPDANARIAELEARLAAIEAAQAAERDAAFMRDAEALAAPAGPPPQQASARASWNAMNPGITAFGDLVGQIGVSPDGVMPGSTVYLRSLELQLRADVDPFAKADAVIAFEQEAPPLDGGPSEGFGAEPEEVYLDLVALPWRLSARVGKFKAPFGIINRTHPHDLPWTDVPEALSLVGDEGYNDTGGTLAWLLPLGRTAVTFTAGAFAGEPFDPDGERAALAGLGRVEVFTNAGNVDVGLGGSVLQDFGTGDPVTGADLTFRWRPNQRNSVVVLAEGFRGKEGDLGGYAALQVQPSRSIYLGFREDVLPAAEDTVDLKHSLFLTYYTSEFLRVRVGGGYAPASQQVDALAQLTFVWGSHPVEPWWVNR